MDTKTDLARSWVLWTSGVIVAVLIASVLTTYVARDNLIAGCKRTSAFKNTEASAWEEAARARTKDGDLNTALFYRNTAFDIRLTIPISDDYTGLRGQLASDRAKGCEESFPNPIPFVE